ncbi:FUSC family protein [Subtercola endophyticus]|uniref:FUSC family protein n=1 Tax=Subtercola endophyticus TaxID=2895559 RepID=UPI001E58397A|nr:FUSC family protein [Subtercola endophyticus]UFS59624.1 FUSC family protein [Subtercola endophyticus]
MRFWRWLGRRDPVYAALRRATRTAIIMPTLFAVGARVIGDAEVATFAAFGSFAMLLLVDFSGPMRQRIEAQIALAVTGAVFVVLGTLVSSPVWLAALAMAAVTFAVLFVGTVSSVLASASTSLLLAFILPVTLPGGVEQILPRLAGWGLASVVGVFAIALLWPAPVREPLRAGAARACQALAARLHADVDFILSGRDPQLGAEYDRATVHSDEAVAALHTVFLATPYRPTGLSTSARTVVRLIDELNWLQAIVAQSPRYDPSAPDPARSAHVTACRVKSAAAAVLETGAELLLQTGGAPAELEAALARLTDARRAVEVSATMQVPVPHASASGDSSGPSLDGAAAGVMDRPATAAPDRVHDFISALDPRFRAQELSYAVSQVGTNIALTAEAERRTWWQRLLGRQPGNLVGTFSAGAQRAAAQFEWHSVWLHNSIRGAAALGIAVLLADVSGLQHSFWIVLGTLSVLRSNALSTGQNALRGVLGTVIGVAIGAAVLFAIGPNSTLLWVLLPLAILVAGVAPTVISFAAGQAGFTVTLVLLFNIISPTGWSVGLFRIEDIVLGCAVSLLVGLLFWPRGAAAALRTALAEAYAETVAYLTAAVAFGVGRCDTTAVARPAPTAQAQRAAAASRRLDDTFRTYLAERGPKQAPLAQVTAAVAGVAAMRLASDAILDVWQGEDGATDAERAMARIALEMTTDELKEWFRDFGEKLVAREPLPSPLGRDPAADDRLAEAVRRDLSDESGNATATAVRIIWTGDYLDVVRRIEPVIVVGDLSLPPTPAP